MRILLTGASGFLGQELLKLLRKESHDLILLGNHKPSGSLGKFYKADITDKKSLKSLKAKVGKLDCVIHLAALVPKTPVEDVAEDMFRVNVLGTINMLEIFGGDLKNFVYASTAEVYGLPESSSKITEDNMPRPLSYYGASKLAGELFCRSYSAKNNLPISSLRFTIIYGPGDKISRAIPNFINKALSGESLEVYGGEELRDYLHINDAAQSIYLAAIKAVDGTFNVGTSKGITIRDTAEQISQKINPDSKIKILPRQKKASDIVLSTTRIKNELNFKPKHIFPDELEGQIEWHKKNLK